MLKRSLRTDIFLAFILLFAGVNLTGWKNVLPFLTKNFTLAFYPLLTIAFLLLIVFYFIGKKRKSGFLFGFHFWLTLLVYPLWALIQQLIVILLVYLPVFKLSNSPLVAVFFGSLFFAALHLPNFKFFLATLFGELIFLTVFSQTGNILAVAICHSLIAPSYYFWVHGDDVLKRRFAGR
ncbi:MAG: hypothetical protein QHH09_00500 [Microgenomates group bacterium]|nr:hypothetical protein [Microgenomates group bacterium]